VQQNVQQKRSSGSLFALGCLSASFITCFLTVINRLTIKSYKSQQPTENPCVGGSTARKYRRTGKLPSQCKPVHDWPTREDAFKDDWSWIEEFLKDNPSLEAKTLFEVLQREKPGKYHVNGGAKVYHLGGG